MKDKKLELAPIHKRMDEDKDLINLADFVLKESDGVTAMKGIYNVTRNRPLLFMQRVTNLLSASDPLVEVLSEKLKDKETSKMEQFISDLSIEFDRRLAMRGEDMHFPVNCSIVNARGPVASRITCYLDKEGNVVPYLLPLDTRFFYCEMGQDGMIWGAYETTRTKAGIKNEYGIDIQGTDAPVIDFYDGKENEIFINEKPQPSKSHPYGKPPFAYQRVASGIALKDKDMVERQSDSILGQTRSIWPEANAIASILKTISMRLPKPAQEYRSQEGINAQIPQKDPLSPGTVTAVDPTGGYKAMDILDIKDATRLLHNIIDTDSQDGSLPTIDFGGLNFPLSTQSIAKLSGTKDHILLARLQALALLYQQIYEMAIEQIIAIGKPILLGNKGFQKTYTPSDLKGEYMITFKYYTHYPEQDAENLTMAEAQKQFLDEDTILRDTMKAKNPTEIRMKRRMDTLEKIDPVILMYNTVHNLIDAGRNLEAWAVADRCMQLASQRELSEKEVSQQLTSLNSKGSQIGNVAPLRSRSVGGASGGPPAIPEQQPLTPAQPMKAMAPAPTPGTPSTGGQL